MSRTNFSVPWKHKRRQKQMQHWHEWTEPRVLMLDEVASVPKKAWVAPDRAPRLPMYADIELTTAICRVNLDIRRIPFARVLDHYHTKTDKTVIYKWRKK